MMDIVKAFGVGCIYHEGSDNISILDFSIGL
jgi:hypothetical protein